MLKRPRLVPLPALAGSNGYPRSGIVARLPRASDDGFESWCSIEVDLFVIAQEPSRVGDIPVGVRLLMHNVADESGA